MSFTRMGARVVWRYTDSANRACIGAAHLEPSGAGGAHERHGEVPRDDQTEACAPELALGVCEEGRMDRVGRGCRIGMCAQTEEALAGGEVASPGRAPAPSACAQGWKIRSIPSGAMPRPLSTTMIRKMLDGPSYVADSFIRPLPARTNLRLFCSCEGEGKVRSEGSRWKRQGAAASAQRSGALQGKRSSVGRPAV